MIDVGVNVSKHDKAVQADGSGDLSAARQRIGRRTLVLVGMMGAGKTTVGRRLAARMDLPFFDADQEIETAAGRSISQIFEDFGEAQFRDGERRVIARLLDGPPAVLATGGGAFMQPDTRALILDKAISIWLRADLDLLVRRVSRRNTRPLLKTGNPREIMENLMIVRNPIYASADITVETDDTPHDNVVQDIILTVDRYLADTGRRRVKS